MVIYQISHKRVALRGNILNFSHKRVGYPLVEKFDVSMPVNLKNSYENVDLLLFQLFSLVTVENFNDTALKQLISKYMPSFHP